MRIRVTALFNDGEYRVFHDNLPVEEYTQKITQKDLEVKDVIRLWLDVIEKETTGIRM